MSGVRWLDREELHAWRSLQLMQMRLEAELARRLAADSGLSYPDYLVLVSLTDRPDGRMRFFELADTLAWEKSRLSHQVARMQRRDLVTKEKCDDDRRGTDVAVTPDGRRAIESAAPGHVDAVRDLFVDRLDRDQLRVIGEVADIVLSVMDDGGDPVSS